MQAVIDEHLMTEVIEKDFKEHGEKVPQLKIPKDKYFLCHLVFLLLGIVHILPMTFFSAANNFWIYKFRNLSDPTNAPGNRTSLLTHFASTQMIVNTVPTFFFGAWNVMYGHRFKIMNRVKLSLIVEVIIFFIFTAFVKLNTDNYQTTFFVLVMICWGTLTVSMVINIVSSTLLYPRFPHTYMKTCMIGEGLAGLLGDILNIISVAVFDDVRDSTLMYFLFGSFMVTITLILILFISKIEFFNHCLNTMPEDVTKDRPSRQEMLKVLYKVRLSLFLSVMMGLALSSTHTSITSLVVSEKDSSTTWASKFFAPVITFFWTDCWMLVGRFLATHSPLQYLPDVGLFIISIVRTIVLVPLIWFCNAQPRNHLPVLFPHDYQYALIMGVFMMLNGYLMNSGMLLIPRKTNKHEAEIAYMVFSVIMGVINVATSPIGTVIVEIL